ncbi:hypothetical protein HK104_005231 [Borealophlyctis nickersoniae]|nr:hypothetical protein HK104_005231 [Borealophlyctis nickersoniae]
MTTQTNANGKRTKEAEKDSPSKKVATEKDSPSKNGAATKSKADCNHPEPIVHSGPLVDLPVIDLYFGVSADVLYETILDPKKFGEATGMPGTGDGKVGGEFSYADGWCTGRNVHLVPNKLIVQEWREGAWPETIPSSTVIYRFAKSATPDHTRVTLTHIGVPQTAKPLLEKGWYDYVFNPIKKHLKDDKTIRPPRTGANLCHVEIPAKDPERASKFYADVFGWDVSKWMETYYGFTSGPKDSEWGWVDGGFPKEESEPTGTKSAGMIPYYGAAPVEDYEKKVIAAGGKVIEPKNKKVWGTVAGCLDTEGNKFYLYQM